MVERIHRYKLDRVWEGVSGFWQAIGHCEHDQFYGVGSSREMALYHLGHNFQKHCSELEMNHAERQSYKETINSFSEHHRDINAIVQVIDVFLINGTAVRFHYVNYKGESAIRSVIPKRIYFAATEHHKLGWMLDGYDIDKKSDRTFEGRSINNPVLMNAYRDQTTDTK